MAEVKHVEIFAIDYPPYTIVDDQNNLSGIDIEVVKASFAKVGIKVKFSTAPWERIRKNLEHGYIAGYTSCARRPAREAYILFSDKVSEANQVALMANDTDDSQLTKLTDLSQYKVNAIEAWAMQKELASKEIPHSKTQDMDSGIRSVLFRDIDVFYIGELTALYRVRQLGLQDKIKTKRFTDKESVSFYLCLSKTYPGNTLLLEQFNTGLEHIKTSGELDEIYDRYL
ncbi:polar amino acid transport system substrate-binding protein [Amphritea japonica ATCC BAA-1530]|uniref:Polar amino acid transport system substrate-binding protein n=2 Tax=Amphritea TaxID=515417 RepID=A0A7R6PE71_9GAMM|nr:polar amino acid transport system substrate-binding protein [Amphritea japonica ATCC BAA-1530]